MADIESASKIARYLECEASLRLAVKTERLKVEEWNRSKQRVLEEKSKVEEIKNIITAPNTLTLKPAACTLGEDPAASPDSQQVTSTSELYSAICSAESKTFTIYPQPKRTKLFADTRSSAEEAPAVGTSSRNRSKKPVTSLSGDVSLEPIPPTEPKKLSSKLRKSILFDSLTTNTQLNAKKHPTGCFLEFKPHPKRRATRTRKTASQTTTKTPLCTSTPKKLIKSLHLHSLTSSTIEPLFEPKLNVNKVQNNDEETGSIQNPAHLPLDLNATLILTPEEPEVPVSTHQLHHHDASTTKVGDVSSMSIHFAQTQSSRDVKPALLAQETVAPIDKNTYTYTQAIIDIITSIEEPTIEIPPANMQGFFSVLKLKPNPNRVRIAPYIPNRYALVNAFTKTGSQILDKTLVNTKNCTVQKAQYSLAESTFVDNSLYGPTMRRPTRPTLPVSIKASTERLRALIQEKYKEAMSDAKIPQFSPPSLKSIDRFTSASSEFSHSDEERSSISRYFETRDSVSRCNW